MFLGLRETLTTHQKENVRPINPLRAKWAYILDGKLEKITTIRRYNLGIMEPIGYDAPTAVESYAKKKNKLFLFRFNFR